MEAIVKATHEASKLYDLALAWDMTPAALIDEYALEDAVPGICMNPGCGYTTGCAADLRGGWCEKCGTPSVKSGIVLAGII